MSYAEIEGSVEDGQPICLFKFVTGPGVDDVLCYTDCESSIFFSDTDHGLRLYKPIAIDRDSIKNTGSDDHSTLNIDLDTQLEIVELLRYYPPSEVVKLFIRAGHVGDPDNEFITLWSGRVLNCAPENPKATLSCEPVSATLRRNGLRRNYQYGCMHVLYGPQCRAIKREFQATVLTLAGSAQMTVNVAGLDAGVLPEQFRNGMIQWKNDAGRREVRNIYNVEATGSNWLVTVSGAILNLPTTGKVTMFRGCKHTVDDCKTVHNNILNYGGDPWIPLQNPIGLASPFL